MVIANISSVRAQLARDDAFYSRYHLDKVVMVGRHHVRSGAITKGERRITPHLWHQWSVADGNLTERGAMLERRLGEFYRQWTMKSQLFVSAVEPDARQVRIYANSLPRTVETAQNFVAGFSPDNELEVDYDKSVSFGSMSPVFNDISNYLSDRIQTKVLAEVDQGCWPDDFATTLQKLEKDAALIAQVIDLKDSPACQQNDTCSFNFLNSKIYLHLGWMPRITGGNIYLAQLVSGNLILQYYDMPENRGYIFGHPVSFDDLRTIGGIKDKWCFLSMGFPTIGRDIAHNLLVRLKEEIDDRVVRLSYLVGHDSNMAALTGALCVENYTLEQTPETKTPLGGKVTFEIWRDEDGHSYVGINYVYQSIGQIMDIAPLDLETPPMICPLRLKGLKETSDGLYRMEDFMSLLNDAIEEFNVLDTYKEGDVNLDREVDMLDVVDVVRHIHGKTWKTFVEEVADDNGDGRIDDNDAAGITRKVSLMSPKHLQ